MLQRRSLGWPITLGVVMIVLVVALTIGWVLMAVVAARGEGYFVAVLAVGAVFFVLVLVGVVLYLMLSVKEIQLNQRQSNFIDSVTHELKSPIASLKLYLQTLTRRQVNEQQQADFYRFMLEDLERLDNLINQMLEAARLDRRVDEAELEPVDVSRVLADCAKAACQVHRVDASTVAIDAAPALVRARPVDVELLFSNLIDNAVKYGGDSPQVAIDSWLDGRGHVVTRITDNGPGIPAKQRRQIFGRFVRLGNELERSKTGTGLGLFIVRTLVKRLKGSIEVYDRGGQPGTVFQVRLPLQPENAPGATAA